MSFICRNKVYLLILFLTSPCLAGEQSIFDTNTFRGYTYGQSWHFDENTGSILHDSSGRQTANITAASWTSGWMGSALRFNSAGALASIPGPLNNSLPSGNQSFRIRFRFRMRPGFMGSDGKMLAFGQFLTGDKRLQLGTQTSGGTLSMKSNTFDNATLFNVHFDSYAWNNFCYAWNGTKLTETAVMKYNGNIERESVVRSAMNLNPGASSSIIGNTQTEEGDAPCKCDMDELEITLGSTGVFPTCDEDLSDGD